MAQCSSGPHVGSLPPGSRVQRALPFNLVTPKGLGMPSRAAVVARALCELLGAGLSLQPVPEPAACSHFPSDAGLPPVALSLQNESETSARNPAILEQTLSYVPAAPQSHITTLPSLPETKPHRRV